MKNKKTGNNRTILWHLVCAFAASAAFVIAADTSSLMLPAGAAYASQNSRGSTIIYQPAVTALSDSSAAVQNETSESEYTKRIFALINNERKKAGVKELAWNSLAASAAYKRACEASSCFSHTRPDGRSFYTVFDDLGENKYLALGENLAMGQHTPEEAVKDWMNSDGHRANILNPDFAETGISCTPYGESYVWVQEFYTGR